MKLNRFIDHTLLRANATTNEIVRLMDEAVEYDFFSVCIQPSFIAMAAKYLQSSNVIPISVVGFPLGANTSKAKAWEAQEVVNLGAKEIDMVIAIARLMETDGHGYLVDDIASVVEAVNGVPVKVIIETAYLTPEQIRAATRACVEGGAQFVKTSTGFASRGASLEDVATIADELTRLGVRDRIKIKASGGIKTAEDARGFITAGADRLGTSSGIAIVQGLAGAAETY